MIWECLCLRQHERERSRLGRPRFGLFVCYETDPFHTQSELDGLAYRHVRRAPNLQDGDAEALELARGEGPRGAIVQGRRPRTAPGVLQPEQEVRDSLPGGVHPYDLVRPELHRGTTRARGRRATPEAASAGGP